jgi:6-pyruvoyltetrahydropterin/6-carboxytetrahydropterin synthase
MWEVSVVAPLVARHQVRGVSGQSGEAHTHRWRIRVAVRSAQLDDTGWVLDFKHLGVVLRALIAPFESAFLNDVAPFDDVNPTRENFARVLADSLAAKLDDGRARVHRVEIWEEDVCCATYFRSEISTSP